MLKLQKNRQGNIELKLGPYFKGFISTLSGFMMLCCILLTIILLLHPSDNTSTVIGQSFALLFFFLIFLNLFLGFEGIEFDTEKKTFKHYKKRLGIKTGDWKSLEPYSLLCLSAQYNSMRGSSPTGSSSGKHRSLEINMASKEKKIKPILLAECKNYKEAQKHLSQLNDFLSLEIKDFVAEEYAKVSPRK